MDITIQTTANGIDAAIQGNDLATTDSFTNMILLAWFSGNPKAVTTGNEEETQEREDWWGNSLLFNNNPSIQFNSFLENLLNNIALDSEGRILIEEAAKKDLDFFGNFGEVNVDAFITSDDRVQIEARVQEPENEQALEFQVLWDNLKNEIIVENTL